MFIVLGDATLNKIVGAFTYLMLKHHSMLKLFR